MWQGRYISVIIPALNEAASLPRVLQSIPLFVDQIIVADNGSTDQTYAIAHDKALHPAVMAVSEPRRGYGAACLKAMQSLTPHTDIVVFMDADFSDDPHLLPDLLKPFGQAGMEMVISNRFTPQMEKGALSLAQYFGNKLAVFLIKLFWGYAYSDLGPMRAITYTALQRLQMQDRDFGWTIEMQIKALDCNLAITQIDVPYRNRFQGESKVSGTISGTFGAGWKILSRIFYYRFLVKKVSKP